MEVDKSNYRQVILDSIKQLDLNLGFFNQFELKRRSFDKVVLCGMGGSALVGDLFDYFKKHNCPSLIINLPLFIHRSYDLPANATINTLVICISYSGNTEETLSAYQKARQEDLEVAAIASGGKLTDFCQLSKNPWIKIPANLQPRASLGYQLSALIKIFMAYGLLGASAGHELTELSKKIIPSRIEYEAKILCPSLNRKIPVIYSSDKNEVIARIWKIKFNECSKIPAFWNSFPELNHNEMVGWTNNQGSFHFLFLQDDDDLPRIQKRMNLTAELLKQQNLPVEMIKLSGEDPLEKLFYGITFGDWLSYHLAIFYGIDPTPVQLVEELKKKLTE
jgi:glucose/mannose-6-phosphate isomerase